jgi:broad specificity phosphatase PhoE
MKRLFLARHAQSKLNEAGLFAGVTETPLTERGKVQATKAGYLLKLKCPKIDLIVASPLSRAYETAEIIAMQLGSPKSQIIKNELFIERNFGVLEGTSYKEFWVDHNHKDLDALVGAENVEQLHARAIKAYSFLQTLEADNILVVSHGSFARALWRVVKDLPHTHEYFEGHRRQYSLKNAEIIEII